MRILITLCGSILVATGCGDSRLDLPVLDTSADNPEVASLAPGAVSPSEQAAALEIAKEQTLSGAQATARDDDPEAVILAYFEATKSGDPTVVNLLLTRLARTRIEALDIALSPPVSETARFEVIAHQLDTSIDTISWVDSRWTEVNLDGERESISISWMLRREEAGWRIARMIPRGKAGETPPEIDFEDPAGTLSRLEAASR